VSDATAWATVISVEVTALRTSGKRLRGALDRRNVPKLEPLTKYRTLGMEPLTDANLRGGVLDELQALGERCSVAVVKLEVDSGSGDTVESDGLTDHEGEGLRFGPPHNCRGDGRSPGAALYPPHRKAQPLAVLRMRRVVRGSRLYPHCFREPWAGQRASSCSGSSLCFRLVMMGAKNAHAALAPPDVTAK
jgi:hypothetical protein